MPKFLSILRGINVSGQKTIAMTELKQLYESLGFKNVNTYIQSGNVIFENSNEKNLATKIESEIKKKFGFDVPVLILTKEELEQTVFNNTFLKQKNIEPDKLHVTYLETAPSSENLQKLKTIAYPPDEYVIIGNKIYLYCPNGYGKTKLTNTFFENKLKVRATTRNWKTTLALSAMME